MSFNDQIYDITILRGILLESLKTSYANKVSKAYLDILNDMIKQLKTYDEVNISNVNAVIKELQQRIDPKVILLSDMQELALVEASYIPTAINAVAGYEMFKRIPRDSTLLKIANGDLFQGHTISQVLKSFDTKIAYDLQDEVKVAVMNGETIPQIRDRLNKLMNVKRSQAETIARTATSTLVEQVRMETYSYNEDILKGYQWVATLDSRTRIEHSVRDGLLWGLDKKPIGHNTPYQQTPFGMNCRCVLIGIVKSFKEMGIDDDDKEIPPATRSSLDGAIPQKTTFTEWFKGKDKAFQEKYLGVGRFELFEKGKITISDLVTKSGKVRTIKELNELSQ